MKQSSSNIYGIVDSKGVHHDISRSLQGAKCYATANDYNKVSVRYNAGYDVDIVAIKKQDGKWHKP